MNKNVVLPIAMLSVLLLSVFVAALDLKTVQAARIVRYSISTDTTWTKADSPYTFYRDISVDPDVTLTIEAGVTINLNQSLFQVRGTLHAQGSNTEKIIFNGDSIVEAYSGIEFSPGSKGWNELTSTGSILENAILNFASIRIDGTSPKINNNSISHSLGSPVPYVMDIYSSSSIISNNTIMGHIGIHGNSPKLHGNYIFGSISIGRATTPTISNNVIERKPNVYNSIGIIIWGNPSVTGNTIRNHHIGIHSDSGFSIIERNLIVNNEEGIRIGHLNGTSIGPEFQTTIRNNTFANNSLGINTQYNAPNTPNPTPSPGFNNQPMIVYNNIENNSQYDIYFGSREGLNASYNWWGTTDSAAIAQKVFDNKNNASYGTVDYIPFLTQQNPNADPPTPPPMPIVEPTPSPTPTPNPSSTISPTPSPSPSPTLSPTPTPSSTLPNESTPTPTPSGNPTANPTEYPTPQPSATPTKQPTPTQSTSASPPLSPASLPTTLGQTSTQTPQQPRFYTTIAILAVVAAIVVAVGILMARLLRKK